MDEKQKRMTFGAIGVIIGLIIAFLPPPEGLDQQGMLVLGIFAGAIIFMALDVFPEWISLLLMAFLFVAVADIPIGTAFDGFSSPVGWLTIAALTLATALRVTNFAQRLALWMLKVLPGNYFGQSLALVIGGIFLSAAVPSSAPRNTVITLPTMGISKAFGFADQSKESTGLGMSAYTGASVLGNVAFLTACGSQVAIYGMLPEHVQADVPWALWTLYALPLVIILFAAMVPLLNKMYSPDSKAEVSKEYVEEQLKEMGPMGKKEKTAAIIALVTVLAWLSGIVTGLDEAMVAIGAMVAILVFNVLEPPEFISKVPFHLWFLVSIILGISPTLASVEVDEWIASILIPLLEPLLYSPYVFLLAFFFVALLLRLIIPSLSVPGILLITSLGGVAESAGISPFVLLLVYVLVSNHWLMPHLNPTRYLIMYSVSEGTLFTHKQARPFAFLYLAIALIAAMVTIPYWQLMGLIQ
ncbi:SLC13 family permease [Natranaerofaba carboxydovora]|uniref:SLC13 family permease n=1 Tax=Natranaerofaba carboxydovora TaxID=2742683 RepID=UPI001F134D64|nr:SLC13 family permease [Natranaerofaba carboxydovora]UMZ74764.1 Inner membrane protein YbhI [Natranaerofaba carboxydovora]